MSTTYAISIDVGGTFTDFVLFNMDTGEVAAFHKVLTDSGRPERAVMKGWREILEIVEARSDQIQYAVHSTTIVTNAIVGRTGVPTGLLTTQGFRDVLEIGIEQLYDIYDLFAPYPKPLIPRPLRREVEERISRDGEVLQPLDEDSVRQHVDDLVAQGVESIAIALIHAYRNPDHERRIAELIAEDHPGVSISISSQVAPIMGEYERSSTVAADAYVKPLLRRYLKELLTDLRSVGYQRPLYLMLSSGGITTGEAAMEFPIRLLESGPAAGAFAASYFGKVTGHDDLLSFDMGGTTAKAALIENGRPGIAGMLEADRVHRFKPGSGLPIMAPTVDLIEIGAGGGSIAHVNQLGLLAVGPQSAEADPGPASYGLGGELPTVTDGNALLGYLDPGYFLGGRMSLQPDLAEQAIQKHVASNLNLPTTDSAWGIHVTVNENMASAARTHLIERNIDPRDVAMVAFGGAGPAHAVSVARVLGIRTVIAPFGAGVASAIGALTAPMALPLVRAYMTPLDSANWEHVARLYREMREDAVKAFHGFQGADELRFQASLDMRFAGQYHELLIGLQEESPTQETIDHIIAAFHEQYAEVYGRAPTGLSVEVLNWHLEATSPQVVFQLAKQPEVMNDGAAARKGERSIYFGGVNAGYQPSTVFDRYKLRPGARMSGPCVIEEKEATVVVPPDCTVSVDGYLNLHITLESGV